LQYLISCDKIVCFPASDQRFEQQQASRVYSSCHITSTTESAEPLFQEDMSSTKRPPNELESRLHQAALASSKQVHQKGVHQEFWLLQHSQEITPQQCESIIPESKKRSDALNFLLAVGLFKTLKDPKGNLLFRAVSKNELVA
jgi:hypothetical protein